MSMFGLQHPISSRHRTAEASRFVWRSVARRLLNHPQRGAVGGAVVVWSFFALVAGDRGFLSEAGAATYLAVSAELGILSVAVALLMIAGEFDLSIGSTIGASGMATALLTVEYGWPVWAALAASFGFAILIGLVNGLVVIRTKLPSFIVTLAMLFIVRGSTIGITREITGRTQLGGVDGAAGYASAHVVFASSVSGFSIAIVWWLVLAAAATVVLQRTRFGHWILGAGRSADAARNLGVPV